MQTSNPTGSANRFNFKWKTKTVSFLNICLQNVPAPRPPWSHSNHTLHLFIKHPKHKTTRLSACHLQTSSVHKKSSEDFHSGNKTYRYSYLKTIF